MAALSFSFFSLSLLLFSVPLVWSQASLTLNISSPWIFSTNNAKANLTQRLRLGVIGFQNTNAAGVQNNLVGALVAAEYLNNNASILPNTGIDLYISNYSTDTEVMFDTLYQIQNIKVHGLVATQTSTQSRVAQGVAKLYEMPQISPTALSYILSDKNEYPYFLRTPSSDAAQSAGIVAFLKSCNWTKGVVIYTQNDYGGSYTQLITLAGEKNISLVSIACTPSGTTAADYVDLAENLKSLSESSGYRIFILYTDLPTLYVAQAIYNANLTGPEYVLIFTGGTVDSLRLSTNKNFRAPYFQGAFGFGAGLPNGVEYDLVRNYWSTIPTDVVPASTGFANTYYLTDAVLMYAYAYDSFIRDGIDPDDVDGATLLAKLLTQNVTGTTGEIILNSNGDRMGSYELWNWVGNNETRNVSHVGSYSLSTGEFSILGDFIFYDGTSNVPRDSPYVCPTCSHGTCVTDVGCVCDSGWKGVACDVKDGNNDKLISWLVPVIVVPVLAIIVILAIVWTRRKRRMLVKEVTDRQKSQLVRSDIVMQSRIGRGAAGEVYKGLFRGTEVAVKKIITSSVDKSVIEEFELEVAIMCGLRHPNIILFMGSCFDAESQEMLIVMEYMTRGSLNDVITNPKMQLSQEMLLHLAIQAAQGMNFLHQSNIIHHDLKSHNILLDDKWNARISDFGITRLKDAKKGKQQTTKSIGTIYWTAPEVLTDSPNITEKIDCYSFGVVLWEIFHRQAPYLGRDPMSIAIDVIRKELRPPIDPAVQPEIQALIRDCWAQSPDQRPSFQDIINRLRSLSADAGTPVQPSLALSTPSGANAPTGLVYLVATEVVGAYSLWDAIPRSMESAMRLHNSTLRANMAKHRGYEASFLEHSFLVAFGNLEDAVNFCASTQVSLLNVEWPSELLTQPKAKPVYGNSDSSSMVLLWKGLRVKMAICSGVPNCSIDSSTGRMTYFGPVTEKLQRILDTPQESVLVDSALAPEIKTKKFLLDVSLESTSPRNSTNVQHLVIKSLADRSSFSTRLPDDDGGASTMPHAIVTVDEYEMDDIPQASLTPMENTRTVDWIAKYSEFGMQTPVGKGPIGDFFQSSWRGKDVALKVLINQKLKEEDMFRLIGDAAIMSKMTHPNLLPFYALCIDPNHITIVSEFKARGNLKDVLADQTIQLSYSKKVKIMLDVARGMSYLASFPDPTMQMHDNLKSNNVMVGKDWDVRVADYGNSNIRDLARTLTSVGNIAWTAPEILNGEPATPLISIYSFGIILWETYTRQVPYGNEHPIRVVTRILGGYRPPIPADCPTAYAQLIQRCLESAPAKRPSWNEIVNVLAQL